MKALKTILRYLIAWPTFVWGGLYVLLLLAFGLAKRPAFMRPALLVVEWRPWVARRWMYTTTVGRGIALHPQIAHGEAPLLVTIMDHERVHVRQTEDLCLMGLVGAVLVVVSAAGGWIGWLTGTGLWVLSPLGLVLNYFMAWLRGKDPYLGAEHEIAAYAQHGG